LGSAKEAKDMTAMPELLTIDELCEHLKVSRQAIYQWIADGKFPAATHRLGRLPRWDAKVVVEHMNRTAPDKHEIPES